MTHLLGRQDCVESLRRDLIDLQGAVLDVFSRTGPVRFPSWKFPDKLSCNLDLVSLLEQYDFVDGEEEFNQHSHIVLLELVIDRLLLLLQSFNVHAEQLKCGQKREYTQQTGPCVSIGLVVRHYWNNLVQLGNKQGMSKDIQEVTKTTKCQEKTNFSSASSPQSTVVSTPTYPPQKRVIDAPPCPTHRRPSNIPSCSPLISTDTRSVSCQTVVSSLVPCDACAQVQSSLRESGDALVELCQSEGLPSSLQRLLVAVDDTMGQGRLTACDVAQWSTEQRRDMGRVGKHLQEVRATVQPLRDRLLAAEGEREEFRSQMGTAQEELKHERSKHQASIQQLEQRHQEAQTSWDKTERRMQEEQKEFKRGTVSLEDSNSRLNAELSLQRERLHTLECERDELQQQVKALQVEEEAWHKLEERSQTLEAQLSSAQLLLDKEKAKYQNACRQQESIQVKQRSLLERVDALDQECEELRGELGESEYRQTDLQDQLKHISEEKEQLQAQLIQQQALCSELQAEKQRLEVHVDKLKCTVVQLRGEVQELAKRERLLVAFPELNPLPQGPPQSTGDVLLDMEQQLQANGVRIRILEQENATLHSSLVKLREMAQHGGSKMTSPQQLWNHCKPDTPRESQQNPSSYVQRSPLKTSSAGVRKHGVTRKGEDDGDTVPVAMGPCDHVSTAASSLSATSSTSLLSHQTLTLSPDTAAAKTYAKIRQASRARSSGTHQKRK